MLLRLLAGSDIEELEVEHDGARIAIRRDPAAAAHPARAVAEPDQDDGSSGRFVVTSPLVGVFRRSGDGASEPPLEVGDVVAVGQTVGTIEAMRLFNRVQSERPGVVEDLLAQDGQPVEYGQPLLVLRTS